MSCYCKCPVALPHGAVGWFAVCDHNHLLFSFFYTKGKANLATDDNMHGSRNLCQRGQTLTTYFFVRGGEEGFKYH